MTQPVQADILLDMLADARARTFELVEGLDGPQLTEPMLPTVNPMLWEIGHVAWFHEHWILRHLDGRDPLIPNADELYDSSAIPHDDRWTLPLPPLEDTIAYMTEVHNALVARLEPLGGQPAPVADSYFYQLTTYHEDMHDEAFTYTRQTLGQPRPDFADTGGGLDTDDHPRAGSLAGDVEVPGGTFWLGAAEDEPFVFDNEKWAHRVDLRPFRIARAPVTNAEFAAFVEDGGYREPRWWSEAGWQWLQAQKRDHPVYWHPEGGGRWLVRDFDAWRTLPPDAPVIHVSAHEAEAYCRWAGRRLPTEAEWEAAAAGEPDGPGVGLAERKRRFPWGEASPTFDRANLDGRYLGTLDVADCPEGDSAFGCRQMIGNVWEWTASPFEPYPGFSPDPYKDYSQPWFGDNRVLRGGAWATRGRMLRNTWRNFFTPGRCDVLAGFRTCALNEE
ncbi:hypothetical protein AN478_10875 [Thiohalorhabdus denitrificans]|uniref:Iron(II)-dependent oxidoreductase n=1 Tax=Thiohalorhabdus denitrificans TaxID=381306 RepID=A0A0P9CKW4_9GAMM|nr:selenoneine synthase SenA [Thiohalorhabdus denitrificans]KPV39622.1 hypothetical protein AN478_10875 [Thiohalorhabdus denitrificans]SCX96463.1 iron(II)-dependent oxidoreductase [Thiohalorhabdus denitrificans]